jgi:hypothetical protein
LIPVHAKIPRVQRVKKMTENEAAVILIRLRKEATENEERG